MLNKKVRKRSTWMKYYNGNTCTAVLTCNKGCGTQIYFDSNNKSSSGKMIPMEVATHENHTCGGRQHEKMDFSI
jgi:hypothetical protein